METFTGRYTFIFYACGGNDFAGCTGTGVKFRFREVCWTGESSSVRVYEGSAQDNGFSVGKTSSKDVPDKGNTQVQAEEDTRPVNYVVKDLTDEKDREYQYLEGSGFDDDKLNFAGGEYYGFSLDNSGDGKKTFTIIPEIGRASKVYAEMTEFHDNGKTMNCNFGQEDYMGYWTNDESANITISPEGSLSGYILQKNRVYEVVFEKSGTTVTVTYKNFTANKELAKITLANSSFSSDIKVRVASIGGAFRAYEGSAEENGFETGKDYNGEEASKNQYYEVRDGSDEHGSYKLLEGAGWVYDVESDEYSAPAYETALNDGETKKYTVVSQVSYSIVTAEVTGYESRIQKRTIKYIMMFL